MSKTKSVNFCIFDALVNAKLLKHRLLYYQKKYSQWPDMYFTALVDVEEIIDDLEEVRKITMVKDE